MHEKENKMYEHVLGVLVFGEGAGDFQQVVEPCAAVGTGLRTQNASRCCGGHNRSLSGFATAVGGEVLEPLLLGVMVFGCRAGRKGGRRGGSKRGPPRERSCGLAVRWLEVNNEMTQLRQFIGLASSSSQNTGTSCVRSVGELASSEREGRKTGC